jgi:hypothetical protein
VSHVVKSVLSTSFIIASASVVFNLKSRFCKENAWQVRTGCNRSSYAIVLTCQYGKAGVSMGTG